MKLRIPNYKYMNLICMQINGEKILAVTLYGKNRDIEVLQWQQRVMEGYFRLDINYIECPFPQVSHGGMMNVIIRDTIDIIRPDYYLWIDNDCIYLNKKALEFTYKMVENKITVFGQAWMNNHKTKPRGIVHAYASQAYLCFSTELYNKIGRPDCDHFNTRSDTAEEITYRAKELGYCVSLLYPSHIVDPNTNLDASCFQGLGNTYGPNLMYHVSQQNNPKSKELFIEKCKEVLDGKFSN